MPDFSVDDDGEWTMVDGDFVEVSGPEEVKQDVRVCLGLTKGEVQFDEDAGLDPEVVFAAGANQASVAGEYRDVIRQRPGIASVDTPQVGELQPGRSISISYTALFSLDDLNARGAIADKITIKI